MDHGLDIFHLFPRKSAQFMYIRLDDIRQYLYSCFQGISIRIQDNPCTLFPGNLHDLVVDLRVNTGGKASTYNDKIRIVNFFNLFNDPHQLGRLDLGTPGTENGLALLFHIINDDVGPGVICYSGEVTAYPLIEQASFQFFPIKSPHQSQCLVSDSKRSQHP